MNGPSDGQLWGNDMGNGTFSGLMGDIQNNRTDIAWADLYLFPERSQIADFTYPHFFDSVCFLVTKPPDLPKFLSIVTPFDSFTWISFIVTLIMALPVASIFSYMNNGSKTDGIATVLHVTLGYTSPYLTYMKR